ncbi:MAG: hypothetical protein ACLQBQ_13875 [Smithella sp.]
MINDEILLSQLEELAQKLGILVRDENINMEESSSTGGLCFVEGKHILILNSKATVKEKNQVMIKALQQFNLDEIYIKPAIRELLEEYKKRILPLDKF